jgi:hypothetical protein
VVFLEAKQGKQNRDKRLKRAFLTVAIGRDAKQA